MKDSLKNTFPLDGKKVYGFRVRTGLESQGKNGNLGLSQGKSGNFFQSLEKLGFVGKVREKM